MIDFKLLLARILNRLIPMNRLDIEEYTVLDGSEDLAAGFFKKGTLDISKPGYYPVAITSFNSSRGRIALYRLQLQDIASGTGQIEWGITNVADVRQSPTVTVKVLWEKIY